MPSPAERFQHTPFNEVRTRGLLAWLAIAAAVLGPLLWWIGQRAGIRDPDAVLVGTVFYGTLFAWVARQVYRTDAGWGTLLGPVRTRSVAFGVLHQGALDSAIVGLAMVLVYLRTGTLWVPIAAHSLHNGLLVAATLLDPGPVSEQSVQLTLEWFRALWWVGALGLLTSLSLPYFFRRYGSVLRGSSSTISARMAPSPAGPAGPHPGST